VPTAEDDFETICRAFDELDAWLINGPLKNALTWITGGLDYRFDSRYRSLIKAAENDFDSFMDAMSYEADRIANMEW
jgi:hypothetical protein